jgi:hypothetical protein
MRAGLCRIEHVLAEPFTYARPVNACSTQAEDTVKRLQQATRAGLPVLIPGAFEMRAVHPRDRPPSTALEAASLQVSPAAADDQNRVDDKRDGAGRPRERAVTKYLTIFARLWHRALRPAGPSAVRHPPLP